MSDLKFFSYQDNKYIFSFNVQFIILCPHLAALTAVTGIKKQKLPQVSLNMYGGNIRKSLFSHLMISIAQKRSFKCDHYLDIYFVFSRCLLYM